MKKCKVVLAGVKETINTNSSRFPLLKMKFIPVPLALIALLMNLVCCKEVPTKYQSEEVRTQVCIYGATPAGISAAISAAKSGKNVLLIEPTERIGGMLTSGLSHSDFYSFEALTGTFLEFSNRVLHYYMDKYGVDSEQAAMSFHGVFGEPKVNLGILSDMLLEYPNISVLKNTLLDSVVKSKNKIGSVLLSNGNDRLSVMAQIYIDGSYEGDLMALSGVPYTVGREGRDVYGEALAPEKGDDQLQGYNFRFCATNIARNRATVKAPKNYNREDFTDLLAILDSVEIQNVFGDPSHCIFKAHTPPLPNYKYDVNDVSGGVVRLSLPGLNLGWPEGTWAERRQIFEKHLYHNVGLLYFLQNDAEVPLKYREQAREWGWCKDEFTETDNLPPQLYVREARRMIGQYVYKQQDSEHMEGDARAVLHTNSIAIGDYSNNCHGTFHEGPIIGGRHSGEFYNPIPPYQIPYGVLIPKKLKNLMVPGAVSSSHVGFCALRLEYIWMSLGQVSGHAASMAIDKNISVQDMNIPGLQKHLHQDKLATIYISDVPPDHVDFEAVQWWGTLGGFHGLHSKTSEGQRGENIFGQFFQAAVDHHADLNKKLTEATKRHWMGLAQSMAIDPTSLEKAHTRGEFIRAAFNSYSASGDRFK